jgi:DNA-binding NtrC family response regulator
VSVTPAALAALASHSWPGNVRELRNAVERAAVLGGEGPLDPKSFAIGNGVRNGVEGTYVNGTHGANGTNGTNGSLELKTQVEAVERRAISALEARAATAARRRPAGHQLRTLFYKMRRLPVVEPASRRVARLQRLARFSGEMR